MRLTKLPVPRKRLSPCRCWRCGSKPKYVSPQRAGDEEGYHYYLCPRAACVLVWGATRRAARLAWNKQNGRYQ